MNNYELSRMVRNTHSIAPASRVLLRRQCLEARFCASPERPVAPLFLDSFEFDSFESKATEADLDSVESRAEYWWIDSIGADCDGSGPD